MTTALSATKPGKTLMMVLRQAAVEGSANLQRLFEVTVQGGRDTRMARGMLISEVEQLLKGATTRLTPTRRTYLVFQTHKDPGWLINVASAHASSEEVAAVLLRTEIAAPGGGLELDLDFYGYSRRSILLTEALDACDRFQVKSGSLSSPIAPLQSQVAAVFCSALKTADGALLAELIRAIADRAFLQTIETLKALPEALRRAPGSPHQQAIFHTITNKGCALRSAAVDEALAKVLEAVSVAKPRCGPNYLALVISGPADLRTCSPMVAAVARALGAATGGIQATLAHMILGGPTDLASAPSVVDALGAFLRTEIKVHRFESAVALNVSGVAGMAVGRVLAYMA